VGHALAQVFHTGGLGSISGGPYGICCDRMASEQLLWFLCASYLLLMLHIHFVTPDVYSVI